MLLMKALRKHYDSKWILLYVERWLRVPLQDKEGNIINRNKGTPQGGVVSPILANPFLMHGLNEKCQRSGFVVMLTMVFCIVKVGDKLRSSCPVLRGAEAEMLRSTHPYIRLKQGFVYLMAIIDWYSRYVLDWQLSTTLDADFCEEALTRALVAGKCEIFNTDQGSQFTSDEFTKLLLNNDIKISMDGKGRALDNIFVEHLWRSVKYEIVYPSQWETVREARVGLKRYFEFYNLERLHQSLGYKTPYSVYHG